MTTHIVCGGCSSSPPLILRLAHVRSCGQRGDPDVPKIKKNLALEALIAQSKLSMNEFARQVGISSARGSRLCSSVGTRAGRAAERGECGAVPARVVRGGARRLTAWTSSWPAAGTPRNWPGCRWTPVARWGSAWPAWDVAGQVEGAVATCPGVLPGVDVGLESLPGGLKETLVLRSAGASRSFEFPPRLAGLRASLVGGQVVLADSDGVRPAVIPAGSMSDSAGASSFGVTYRLVGQSLRVTVDGRWLADPAVVVHGESSGSGGSELLVGRIGGSPSASYLKFAGLAARWRTTRSVRPGIRRSPRRACPAACVTHECPAAPVRAAGHRVVLRRAGCPPARGPRGPRETGCRTAGRAVRGPGWPGRRRRTRRSGPPRSGSGTGSRAAHR